MIRLSLRNLAAKKFRLVSTALAIVLGVGFTVGTLIVSATMDRSLATTIDRLGAGVDTVVRGRQPVDVPAGEPDERAPVPVAAVGAAAAVDGVVHAAPQWQGYAQVVGRDHKVLDVDQSVALNWVDDPGLSMFELVSGRRPAVAGEVVLDRAAARVAGTRVGQDVEVVTGAGTRLFRLVGTAQLDGGATLGSTAFVILSDADARELLAPPGTVDAVLVRARPGIDESAIAGRVADAVPEAEVASGSELRDEQAADADTITSILRTVLLVFAAIALVVGSFTIANTFTITVAQRTRELALVRAVGGSRRQVMGLVLVEAAALGAAASLVGVVAGLAMAKALFAVLASIGLDLPSTPLVVPVSAVATGIALGVAITVGAASVAARRAARVAPVAAMREAVQDRNAVARLRVLTGIVAGVAAIGVLTTGVISGSSSVVGLGTLLSFGAVVVLGPPLVAPVVGVLGWPLRRLGVTGRVAARNAARNPRRSASTATALTVGVTLVVGASMFAATAKETVEGDVDKTFVADRVVRPAGSSPGIPPGAGAALAAIPGAEVAPVRATRGVVGGSIERITGVDVGGAPELLHLERVDGRLGSAPGTILVSTDAAEEHGWAVGRTVSVELSSGVRWSAVIAGTFRPTTAVDGVLVPYAATAGAAGQLDSAVLLSGGPGVLQRAEAALSSTPTAMIGTPAEYARSISGTFDLLLSLVVGFLGLAVVIAVLGIGTTIALSVRERTPELGVLRSIGMSRRQLRRAVRLEAMVIAVFGAVLGSVLGVACTWAVLRTLADEGFTDPVLPVPALVAVAVGALVAGTAAAGLPARRAARLPILEAIRTA